MARPWVGVAVLCALVLAGSAAADVDVERLVRDLGGADVSRRSTALNQLRNAKDERAIPLLLEAVDGWELFGRYYAVLVLDSYAEETAARAFRKVLGKEDPYLRLCAAAWFLRHGDARHVGVIVDALAREDVEPNTRNYMVNRLYSLDEPRVREALHALLTTDASTSLISAVLTALQNPENEASKVAVRAFLERSDEPDARLMAAAFLYRFGEEARKTEIAEALHSGRVTSLGFTRMRMFLQQAGHAATEILDATLSLLETEDNAFVLRYAVELLALYDHRKALPAIRKLATHENALLAKAVFEAVVVLGGGIEKATLLELLASSDDPSRRVAAADLLRRMDDDVGLPAVVEVLKGGTNPQRLEAVQALARFRVRAAVDPLIDALEDPYASVRSQALSGLDQLVRSLFPYRRLDFVATGYTATAPETERKAAVGRIRAWWAAHRDGGW